MAKTQRKTASEMLKQYNSSKKEILQTIKDIIKEKEITSIMLNPEFYILTDYVEKYSYLEIMQINQETVSLGCEGMDVDEYRFEDLKLDALVSVLELLEGDISEIIYDEDGE
jgi:energy-coupling factor transporter ATP-binding protein EcfA2